MSVAAVRPQWRPRERLSPPARSLNRAPLAAAFRSPQRLSSYRTNDGLSKLWIWKVGFCLLGLGVWSPACRPEVGLLVERCSRGGARPEVRNTTFVPSAAVAATGALALYICDRSAVVLCRRRSPMTVGRSRSSGVAEVARSSALATAARAARSGEWPAWFSFWFSGCWRALAKGTVWAGFYRAIRHHHGPLPDP